MARDEDARRTAADPGPPPRPIPAERARQGRIALRTPAQRWTFVGGLVALVLVLLLGLLA